MKDEFIKEYRNLAGWYLKLTEKELTPKEYEKINKKYDVKFAELLEKYKIGG